ncbi:phospholipid scramblase 1-like [Paramacrobiotus metropolitanus]|uniref:phospholipid scramblase 1-like n=1 Tax=Paramacrobiotus metropolitanus TaxID=2943436 RepID=UPI002445E228|nr:phospholipid scramblase 1-like [Paramacrobiotus metropolitanus]
MNPVSPNSQKSAVSVGQRSATAQPAQPSPGSYSQHASGMAAPSGASAVPPVQIIQPGVAYTAHGSPVVWMAMPHISVPDCPPGLEYLALLDQLLIQQEVELLEVFTSCEGANKYRIKNAMAQQVYYAEETTDCLTRQCCGNMRPFDLRVLDNAMNEVIRVHRPYRCKSCCCFCCLQVLEVTAPPGTVIGYVVQEWSFCIPKFKIENSNHEVMLRIEGPVCTSSCFGNVEFQVLSSDGKTQVGKISKQWSGVLKEMFTDADNFGIQFPKDLDVHMKGTLLGACFLIDFMFFENNVRKG